MSIFVTCAYEEFWCEFVQNRLQEMGISEALPAEHMGLSAKQLTLKMQRTLGNRPNASKAKRSWEVAAADLLLTNSEAEHWGWASPHNVSTLHFWKEFDPDCRFILIYAPPSESLALNLEKSEIITDTVKQELERWSEYHRALVKFYHSNKDISVLMHIDSFEKNAQPAAAALSDAFGITSRRLNNHTFRIRDPISEIIAVNCLANDEVAADALIELEVSADISSINCADESRSLPVLATQHMEELGAKLKEVETLQQTLSALNERLEDSHNENVQNIRLINELRSDITKAEEQHRGEIETLRQDISSLQSQNDTLASEANSSIKQENKLLFKQLQQANRELEDYFQKYNAAKEEISKHQQSTNLIEHHSRKLEQSGAVYSVDLKSFIKGTGWYTAEAHGRWAGLDLKSTIEMPLLAPSSYRFQARIVDAMALGILEEMEIQINGHPIKTSQTILADMGGKLAPLRRLKAKYQRVDKPFPVNVIGFVSEAIIRTFSEKTEVTFICKKTITPTDTGETDNRTLSICVDNISFTQA